MPKPISGRVFRRQAPLDRWAEPEPTIVSKVLKAKGVRMTLLSLGGLVSAGIFAGVLYSTIGFVFEDQVKGDLDQVQVATRETSETVPAATPEEAAGTPAISLSSDPGRVAPDIARQPEPFDRAATIASADTWNSRDVDWNHARPSDADEEWIRKGKAAVASLRPPVSTRAFEPLAYGTPESLVQSPAVRGIEEVLARGAAKVPVPQIAEREEKDARKSKIRRGVNLRSSGRRGAKVVSVLSKGTVVEVLGCDHWCEVKADGRKGYVYHTYLEGGRKLRSASRR